MDVGCAIRRGSVSLSCRGGENRRRIHGHVRFAGDGSGRRFPSAVCCAAGPRLETPRHFADDLRAQHGRRAGDAARARSRSARAAPFPGSSRLHLCQSQSRKSYIAGTYNQQVRRTWRIANRLDLVPQLPPPPGFDQVGSLVELSPVQLGPPPRILVKLGVECQHALNTYLYLLSKSAGGKEIPLASGCLTNS